MNQNTQLNYITTLPDFMLMQRTSFCWFLSRGLCEELQFFSQILDFSQNTEYILYGEEYGLFKSSCTLAVARKYNGNYRAQLVIPIEVRNKKTNTVYFYNKFPLVTLPLMTTAATFILNGCERVIVSQIIRSPGLYFEKLKNQKRQSSFKRKLSTDITKLRDFLPAGQASLSDVDLYFAKPLFDYIVKSDGFGATEDKLIIIPTWNQISVLSYSLKFFKYSHPSKNSYCFLYAFRYYQSLLKTANSTKKIQATYLFFKWLLYFQKKSNIYKKNYENSKTLKYIIRYFYFLTKFLQFYKKINSSSYNLEKGYSILILNQFTNNFNNLIFKEYQTIIKFSLNLVQLQLNQNLIFLTKLKNIDLNFLKDFSILKQKCITKNSHYNSLYNKKNLLNFKSVIYFSKSLKDQLRHIFKDSGPSYDLRKHQYTKSTTRLLIFNEDHKIKTLYDTKYQAKEFYNATLIPEYGSWIRFGFQKNLQVNSYNYSLKHREEYITIQLDKINHKSIILLLKEMGLSDLEIYQNLEHRDFLYFTKPLLIDSIRLKQPLLRFNSSFNSFFQISEFSRIFDPNYYRLGKIGRIQLNKRLVISINSRYQTITYEDIFAIIDKLISLSISKTLPDDIDHLKNRRVRSVGELLQNLFRIGFQRLVRKVRNQTTDTTHLLSFNILNSTVKEFFGSSQLSQYLDQTNPLSSLTHRRRISGLGPGGFERDRISFSVRDIHPSHYGRICPIETPEGQNVGLIASLTTSARVNKLGFLETPFWKVVNGKVLKTKIPIYLTPDIEDLYKIAPADLAITSNNYLVQNVIPVRYKQDFINVSPAEVDFISISPIQVVSVAASLIPFFEHDDANRALMGSNMQRQSVPLLLPQKPIIGTGLENQIATDSGMIINAKVSGIVESVTSTKISIRTSKGHKTLYKLQKYLRSNQETCINHRPIIWKGETVQSGQILTDGPSISSNELALGQNLLIGYMPWQGYNFEDAILISERLIYDDVFTSIHIERYKVDIDRSSDFPEQTTKNIPNLTSAEIENLNNDGIVTVGTFVRPGDILVGKVTANDNSEQLPEAKLLRAIFGAKSKGIKDTSYRMPDGEYGRVIETITFNRRTSLAYKFEKIYIFIAQIRKIQVGDKIAGRHGNKGIISRILARQDMPFLPNGRPLDIILNPLGVPSRMNVGQLYECLLGLAGDKLNCRFKILPFDEMYGLEMSRILINKKLRQASIINDESWLFNPYAPGKMVLLDGRTGKEFENPVTVGNAYMLKLIHLVDDKIHARSTGPYSLITQQPLRGKAQHGGQRFGEMEVWALEGFGASFTLKELLTIKSDDMEGRNETLNVIVKGQKISKFGIPESFKVLLQELRSIGLDMSTYKLERFSSPINCQIEVNLIEKYNSFLKTFNTTSNLSDISF
uniref:RNA polymerase subunit beta n=1 Tax=Thalassionema bacillare TaxID=426664 RepID=UPI001EDF0A09|nr:RNA polymerase subunit beta [Thalassionema bacillare]UHY40485.1 RNA polymerase subunit beta [Thalassionema bacillare]UHY40872.1 RNA polymerase subunit beta [Thalassionema bacillare]UHY41130.1 RNA polymerase subunit beta [Thalassionema bacillare]